MNDLATDISRHVWETKYRYAEGPRRERERVRVEPRARPGS